MDQEVLQDEGKVSGTNQISGASDKESAGYRAEILSPTRGPVDDSVRQSIENEVLNCEANIESSADIPVIDARPLLAYAQSGEMTAAWRQAVAALEYALKEVGFFSLKNHNLDAEPARVASQSFFEQPIGNKMARVQRPDFPFGYTGTGSEKLFLSEDVYEAKDQVQRKGDPKESLNIPPLHLPWSWPEASPNFDADAFRAVITQYFRACEKFVSGFLPSLAYVLGESPTFFVERMREHMSVIRTLNYPASDVLMEDEVGGMRASSHTDFGLLTVLQTFGVPGLQVQNRQGQWVSVVLTEPNDLVINIGDALSRMTNGVFKSTRHRVAKLITGQRQSIAYFVNFNAKAMVETVEKYRRREGNYPPVASGDYIFYKNGLAMGFERR